jgi:hypothetical protein
LRASIAPVSGSIAVSIEGDEAERDGPSTHSTYAVTDSRRVLSDVFRMVRREILTGSSIGTNCRSPRSTPLAECSKRL